MSNSYDGEHNKERNLTSGSGDAFGAEPDEMVDLFAVAENADNRDDAVLPGQSESSGSDFYPIVFDDFSYEDQDEDDEDGYSEEDEDDGEVIPPCGAMFGFEQRNPHHDYDVWEHTVRVVSAAPPDRVLRLAALLHDIGKPECFTVDRNGVGHFYGHAAVSERIAREVFSKYIRTDRRTSDEVTLLVGHHDEQLIPDRKIIRRRLSKYGEETLRRLIALQKADCAGQSERSKESAGALDETEAILNELAGENACVTLQGLAIKGGDLMAMGIPKGPLVGRILNALLAEVFSWICQWILRAFPLRQERERVLLWAGRWCSGGT